MRVHRKGVSRREREAILASRRRGRRECGVSEAACFSGIGRHVRVRVADSGLGLPSARIARPLTTTMLRSAPRITRPTVRLLADQKLPHSSALPNARSLHQRPVVHPILISRNLTPFASTSASTSRLPTQTAIEGLQTRSFASTSRNSARHLRSDDRHRGGVVNRPLVGTSHDDLPRKNRKANPFLPFQASSFVDAFVTTIVGVGISESCKHKRIELNEA